MAQPRASRHALAFVLITVLLDIIGLGMIIPVTPELIVELTGEGLDRAATYGGWLLFVFALLQFVCAPILGNLSDRFGRRPILLASLAAFGADYLLMGLAPSLSWLFVGRALAGMFGATFTTANAFIVDVSPPGRRAQNFGLIGAAFGVGFTIGPVFGGVLGSFGARVPFFAAAVLALINVVYGALVLPETLPPGKRRTFSWRRANPVGALLRMRLYPVVLGLFAAVLLYQLAHDANPSVWTYYTMEKFGWTEREVGYSLGFLGLMIVIVQGGLIRWLVPRLGRERAVYLGLALMALGSAGYAFAWSSWTMYVWIVVFCLGSVAMPSLREIMANHVPEDSQGELQGALGSVVSLTAIIAPVLMTQLFGYFSGDDAPIYFPGAPFLLASVMLIACAALCRILLGLPSHRSSRLP
jgi:DHA1 family tetracycline resistance protein-like MFS transporter